MNGCKPAPALGLIYGRLKDSVRRVQDAVREGQERIQSALDELFAEGGEAERFYGEG